MTPYQKDIDAATFPIAYIDMFANTISVPELIVKIKGYAKRKEFDKVRQNISYAREHLLREDLLMVEKSCEREFYIADEKTSIL